MIDISSLLFPLLAGVVGLALGLWLMSLWKKTRKPEKATLQATTLLEKVRRVCKVVTVEGEFTEILNIEKERLLGGMIPQSKKALIVIKAKAMVGYDMNKVILTPFPDKKTIRIDQLPEPEILSVEDDIVYFDLRQSLFNPFKGKEHAELHLMAKETIRQKVAESTLPDIANKQAISLIQMISEIASIEGWKIDIKGLPQPNANRLPLDKT